MAIDATGAARVSKTEPYKLGSSKIDNHAVETSMEGEVVVTYDKKTGKMKVELVPLNPYLPV